MEMSSYGGTFSYSLLHLLSSGIQPWHRFIPQWEQGPNLPLSSCQQNAGLVLMILSKWRFIMWEEWDSIVPALYDHVGQNIQTSPKSGSHIRGWFKHSRPMWSGSKALFSMITYSWYHPNQFTDSSIPRPCVDFPFPVPSLYPSTPSSSFLFQQQASPAYLTG